MKREYLDSDPILSCILNFKCCTWLIDLVITMLQTSVSVYNIRDTTEERICGSKQSLSAPGERQVFDFILSSNPLKHF